MAILAMIPARGGSKGISKKNIVDLLGKPLLGYTAEAAIESKCFSKVVLSTDSEEIQGVGSRFGLTCENLRPANLALDSTPMLEVLLHEVKVHGLSTDDAICLLQPTSPLRTHLHIRDCVSLFLNGSYDSVVSVQEVPHQFLPFSQMNMNGTNLSKVFPDAPTFTDRQSKPKHFVRNGPAILITKVSNLEGGDLYGKNVGGYLMDSRSSLDIDSRDDLELAEFLINKGK